MKRLTKEEIHNRFLKEKEIIKEYKNDTDKLRDELFKLHYNLPEIWIKKLNKKLGITKSHCDYMDFQQAGFEGMCRAFNKFDVNNGACFFSYAGFWVMKFVYEEYVKLNVIKAPAGEVSCFGVDDLTTVHDEYLEYHPTEEETEIFFDDPIIFDFIESHELEIKVFSLYFIDGVSMSTIAANERISVTSVKRIIRGQRNSKGVQTIKPFMEIAKEYMSNYTDAESFEEFKKMFIKVL